MTIYYCYDAYCGWCYGFSPVITQLWKAYKERFQFEVLSGGMIPREAAKPIGAIAPFIQQAYKTVESRTGIEFGSDFLWHIFNPEESDWVPQSETPAIAVCIFKESYPDLHVPFAVDLEYALNFEGRDLTDPEAYRHLLTKYDLDANDFFIKLKIDAYKQKAHEEIELCRKLQVTGFPKLLAQVADAKFYVIAEGYTAYESIQERVEKIIEEA